MRRPNLCSEPEIREKRLQGRHYNLLATKRESNHGVGCELLRCDYATGRRLSSFIMDSLNHSDYMPQKRKRFVVIVEF